MKIVLIILSLVLILTLVGCGTSQAATQVATNSTNAELQKQVNELTARVKALERQTGSSKLYSSNTLESRVLSLEQKVGTGLYSSNYDSLAKRVSDLESKVGNSFR
jgi:predicted PurR-regulated permease PerM